MLDDPYGDTGCRTCVLSPTTILCFHVFRTCKVSLRRSLSYSLPAVVTKSLCTDFAVKQKLRRSEPRQTNLGRVINNPEWGLYD